MFAADRFIARAKQSLCLGVTSIYFAASAAQAYPPFESFIEKHSHKSVDCSMCHVNSHGPVGKDIGQVGSLSPKELELLNQARVAMEPGALKSDSPILNRFGNSIIRTIGKKQFLGLMATPEKLPEALGYKSDLDGDGIPDAQEYLDGTDPLNPMHGDPWKLFLVNLNRYKYHLLLAGCAIFLLDWGFFHLIRGFIFRSKLRKQAKQAEEAKLAEEARLAEEAEQSSKQT